MEPMSKVDYQKAFILTMMMEQRLYPSNAWTGMGKTSFSPPKKNKYIRISDSIDGFEITCFSFMFILMAFCFALSGFGFFFFLSLFCLSLLGYIMIPNNSEGVFQTFED